MKLVKKYGGGGGSSTTVSTIPDEWKPFITRELSAAEKARTSGELSKVEGFTPEQLKAQEAARTAAGTQTDIGKKVLGAQGTLEKAQQTGFAVDPSAIADNPQLAAMKQAAIRSAQKSIQPGLASAAKLGVSTGDRAAIIGAEQQAALASSLAGLDYQALQDASKTAQSAATQEIASAPTLQQAQMAGADTLQSVGTAIQKQKQAEADATYQGLGRFASLIQGTPWQSQQQTSSGGK